MSEPGRRTPIRVVVIDDSEDIRLVLQLALDREPAFTFVAHAADGLAGLEAVAKHRPHLVLLDISMPHMDGLQVLPAIRQGSPECMVVMLTGFAASHAAESALELGAHGYIQKGGNIPDLMAELRAIVDGESRRLSNA